MLGLGAATGRFVLFSEQQRFLRPTNGRTGQPWTPRENRKVPRLALTWPLTLRAAVRARSG